MQEMDFVMELVCGLFSLNNIIKMYYTNKI